MLRPNIPLITPFSASRRAVAKYATTTQERNVGRIDTVWLNLVSLLFERVSYIIARNTSIILTIIGCLLFSIPVVCGFVFSIIWLWIIGLILILYTITLGIWLIFIETPKYKPGKSYVKYDDFWVEGDATRRGTAFMDKYYPNIK